MWEICYSSGSKCFQQSCVASGTEDWLGHLAVGLKMHEHPVRKPLSGSWQVHHNKCSAVMSTQLQKRSTLIVTFSNWDGVSGGEVTSQADVNVLALVFWGARHEPTLCQQPCSNKRGFRWRVLPCPPPPPLCLYWVPPRVDPPPVSGHQSPPTPHVQRPSVSHRPPAR